MYILQAISANFLRNVFIDGFWQFAEKVESLLFGCAFYSMHHPESSLRIFSLPFVVASGLLGVSSGGRNSSLLVKSVHALEQSSQLWQHFLERQLLEVCRGSTMLSLLVRHHPTGYIFVGQVRRGGGLGT